MSSVLLDQQGRVAVVTLNEPQSMNAISTTMKAGLAEAVPRIMADPAIGCLVITGTGTAFCAGGDLRGMSDRQPAAVRARLMAVQPFVLPLMRCEKPVVAAVNGVAVGAGLSMALLADIIVASETAVFRAGFPGVGAVPDMGLAYTLPRAIGMARARDLLMTNRPVDATEALAIGLTARIAPAEKMMSQAMALAAALADGPTSLGMTRSLLTAGTLMSPEDFLAFEAIMQAQAFASADFAEGCAAFLEKRRPSFPHG